MPLTLADLTERLMASYVRAGGINHVDGKNLPSKQAIAEITADLLRLLFPGFFDETPLHLAEIETVTTALLDSVLGRLETEIGKSLEYAPPAGFEDADPRDLAFVANATSGVNAVLRSLDLGPGDRLLVIE